MSLKTRFSLFLMIVWLSACIPLAKPSPTAIPLPTATSTPLPLPTATPAPQGEIVDFMTEDGVKLAGTLYPAEGDLVVIFAHMGTLSQESWRPFASLAASRGFPVLTFDFRCHGQSACAGSSNILHKRDILAAIAFVHQQGYNRVVCVGASMGGIACMNAALVEPLAGLAVLASPAPAPALSKSFPEDMLNPEMPKLYVVTEQDRYEALRAAVPELYEKSPEPRQLKVFPGVVHGTELFDTEYAGELTDLLLAFLESARIQ